MVVAIVKPWGFADLPVMSPGRPTRAGISRRRASASWRAPLNVKLLGWACWATPWECLVSWFHREKERDGWHLPTRALRDRLCMEMREGDRAMTDRQMRHVITHAWAAARPAPERYYHPCWWEEALGCHPVRHTTEPHEVFLSALGNVLLGELSAVQWRVMINRITGFCERQGIVLDLHSGRGQKTFPGRRRRRWVTEYDAAHLHALLAQCGHCRPCCTWACTSASSSVCSGPPTWLPRAMCRRTS